MSEPTAKNCAVRVGTTELVVVTDADPTRFETVTVGPNESLHYAIMNAINNRVCDGGCAVLVDNDDLPDLNVRRARGVDLINPRLIAAQSSSRVVLVTKQEAWIGMVRSSVVAPTDVCRGYMFDPLSACTLWQIEAAGPDGITVSNHMTSANGVIVPNARITEPFTAGSAEEAANQLLDLLQTVGMSNVAICAADSALGAKLEPALKAAFVGLHKRVGLYVEPNGTLIGGLYLAETSAAWR